MKKRAGFVFALLLGAVSFAGCMTLDYEHDVSVINKYGRDIYDLHTLTEKYFFNYDHDDPFLD